MTRTAIRSFAVVVVAGSIAIGTSVAFAQTPNVIVQWNAIAQTLFGPAPSPALRAMAMLHIAMFDAVTAVEQTHEPYRVAVRGSRGASAEAAAAQAARDVLTALYPSEQARFDDLLASQLARVPPGLAQQGRQIGRRVAQAVLAWRENDGWPAVITPDPTYSLPAIPGLWQPTPPAHSPPTFTFFSRVRPFALLTSTQYLPVPPPPLHSARYAQDFNEVKRLGSATSPFRTDEETLMARVFASVNTSIGFFHVWNLVAAQAAQQEGLSLLETARLFVLVNVGLHDGLQTSMTSKFVYGLWRPVTAIRRADEDFNPDTEQDASWTPLLTTPPYPSHAGNVACISEAAARALELGIGRDDVPFSLSWNTTTHGIVTRHYTGFHDLSQRQADSRIHGGIHFRFESEASQESCARVVEFTHEHYMQPVRR